MTDLSAESTVRSYYDALNARDYARAAGPIAENCEWVSMNIVPHIGPVAALIAGVLILLIPRLLNYIVAVYLIVIGAVGLFGR